MVPYCRRSPRFLDFLLVQRFAPLTGWWYSAKFQKKKNELTRRLLFHQWNMETTWMGKHTKCLDCWDNQVLWIDSQNPYGLHSCSWKVSRCNQYHLSLNKATKTYRKEEKTRTSFSHCFSITFPENSLFLVVFFLFSNLWKTTWAYANPKLKLNNEYSVTFRSNLC